MSEEPGSSSGVMYSRRLPWFEPLPWIDQADGARFGDDGLIPSDAECEALWEHYAMLDNIKAHCRKVADFATAMARIAVARRSRPEHFVEVTRAGGLLHDLAKTYCIRNGGSHATIGAAWVLEHTGNPRIAQTVFHHVEWPWELPDDVLTPALLVGYADRRVRHDEYVTIEERYVDLLERYAKNNPDRRESISAARLRAINLERALSAQLELPLYACTFDCGRLVPRA